MNKLIQVKLVKDGDDKMPILGDGSHSMFLFKL